MAPRVAAGGYSAADGNRHRCQKKVGHDDKVHACKCNLEWKQF